MNSPMPGQEKVVSVSTAPASSAANCRPIMVKMGMKAFLSPWL